MMPEPVFQRIGLVSQSAAVGLDLLAVIGGALLKQVTRDLTKLWAVNAAVHAYPSVRDLPIGCWPVIVRDDVGDDAAGFHKHDGDNQPFALVRSDASPDRLSLALSHECLEMLVNPMGDYLVEGDSPNAAQGRVRFLVEVCDPCEAAGFAYRVDGVLVSDFYGPAYFDPEYAPGTRYSFAGSIREPVDVLRGGYLSWLDVASGDWWMQHWFDGPGSSFERLGPLAAGGESIRTQIDRRTASRASAAMSAIPENRDRLSLADLRPAQDARAEALQRQIERLVAGDEPPPGPADEAAGRRTRRRR